MAKFRYIDADENSRDPFATQSNVANEFEELLKDDKNIPTARRYRMGESITGNVISASPEFIFIDLGGKSSGSLSTEEYTSAGLSAPKIGDSISAFVRSDNGSEILLTRTLRRNEADDSLLRNAFEARIPVEAKVEKTIKGGFEATIGAKRCFIPLGQMDIAHFDNPEVYVGNTFKFLISEFKGRNIVLTRKAILREEMDSKIESVLQGLAVGQNHFVTVTRLVDFGAFASIEGVEALIPLSEMGWKRIKKASEVVSLGEQVTVKIIKIERTPKLKIALSLKEAGEDPWIANATRLHPGEVLQGTVVRMIDGGAFVNVAEGVDGLVPISQITWEKRINHPKDILQVGQSVKVHVMTADLGAHRLSLSIKGPMPEELANKFKSKKHNESSLSEEERTLMKQWEDYKANDAKVFTPANREDTNIFAAAFTKASKKK
ncbi:30S ribosomal protein S1 [Fluviispira multicolorata]|uniref:S1 RNA-binding domain-containing protein n=1 Tax=Fluviispira multicolorata TaxID=2654512 RepID=A0A833JFP9_9BACT|nr:S1 RNA-binding domain-containing protein [Fluviispira multicolorata]KAB8033455.1 S1 RNA-binding domain-containing protein [Fluviispira multicolorata]